MCICKHTERASTGKPPLSMLFLEATNSWNNIVPKGEQTKRVFPSLPCPCIGRERGGVRKKSQQDAEAGGAVLFLLILLCHLQHSLSCAGYGLWLRANKQRASEQTVFSFWILNYLDFDRGKGPFKTLWEGCLLLGFPVCLPALRAQRNRQTLGFSGQLWLTLKATVLSRAHGVVDQ